MVSKPSNAVIVQPRDNHLNINRVFKPYSIGEIGASDVCPCKNSARCWFTGIGKIGMSKCGRVEMGIVEARSA